MINFIPILSIIFLVLSIFIGFKQKINMGLISIASAFILGKIGNLTDKEILNSFNSSLFLMLVGISLLFGIAQINGTLKILIKKIISSINGKIIFIPFLMYIIGYMVGFLGAGTIAGFAMVAVFGIPLAKETKINPFLLTSIGQLGAIGGGIVPWAPTGIIGNNLALNANIIENISLSLVFNTLLITLISSFITFILFKGWKLKKINKNFENEVIKFDKEQKITLISILIMTISTVFFSINIGLISFFISAILLLSKIADEKEVFKLIPWNTLILISGVGILINVIIKLGGIHFFALGLTKIMTPNSAPAILALSSGILSWFSSNSGVVMPTMIPTIPIILDTLKAPTSILSGKLLVSAVVNGGAPASLSPFSTGGALVISALSENSFLSTEKESKLIGTLFLISIFQVFLVIFLIWLGVLNIFN